MGCVSSDLDSRVKATKPARETRNAMNRNFVYSPSKGVEKITARAPGPLDRGQTPRGEQDASLRPQDFQQDFRKI